MPVPFNIDINGKDQYENYIMPPIPLPWVDHLHITEIWKKYL